MKTSAAAMICLTPGVFLPAFPDVKNCPLFVNGLCFGCLYGACPYGFCPCTCPYGDCS